MSKLNELDFPDNIIDDLKFDYESVIDNFEKKLNAVCFKALTPREHTCINLRYVEGKKLQEVSKEIGVTQERTRQIIAKAIRRISRYEYYFTYGYFKQDDLIKAERKKYIDENNGKWDEESAIAFLQEKGRIFLPLKKEKEYYTVEDIVSYTTSIEELDLTARAYNCLKSAGVNKVSDIIKCTYEDLLKIRNLGRLSANEVVQKLADYGFKLKEEYTEEVCFYEEEN